MVINVYCITIWWAMKLLLGWIQERGRWIELSKIFEFRKQGKRFKPNESFQKLCTATNQSIPTQTRII